LGGFGLFPFIDLPTMSRKWLTALCSMLESWS
jgi:hypothetical protein